MHSGHEEQGLPVRNFHQTFPKLVCRVVDRNLKSYLLSHYPLTVKNFRLLLFATPARGKKPIKCNHVSKNLEFDQA